MNMTLDTHVTALISKHRRNQNELLFLSACISGLHGFFGHGLSISNKRATKIHVMLPVTDSDDPDYSYMAKYTTKIGGGMLMRYRSYVAEQLAHLEYRNIPALQEKPWNLFRVENLFEVSRPKARNKDDYGIGNIPFVASGAVNNGVMKCCKPKTNEPLDDGNYITVSPVDGTSFYQPMAFLGRGGAGSSILILRNNDMNLLRGEFMARMIQQTCAKYNYGHMGSKDGIKRERVMLPIDNIGELDYAYMEQYIINMMRKKYEQYLSFLAEREAQKLS